MTIRNMINYLKKIEKDYGSDMPVVLFSRDIDKYEDLSVDRLRENIYVEWDAEYGDHLVVNDMIS